MIVIANPAASGGDVGRDWAELSARVRSAFPDAKLLQTSGAGDGRRLAREAVESGASRVLSLGGDGTHNEVINGLLDASPDPEAVTFGALPAGTGGDFCRMYACDKTIDATLEHLRAGVTSPLDLGVVEGLDDDGEPLTRAFLNIASCGASGLVVEAPGRESLVLHREPPSHLGLHARDREVAPRRTRHRDVRDQQRARVQRPVGRRRHVLRAGRLTQRRSARDRGH